MSPLFAPPWYVHPAEDPAAWAWLDRYAAASFVVVNVADGPGEPADPYYPEALRSLRHPLIGYVDVAYGRRSIQDVVEDVNAWLGRYPVTGIMFDQVPADMASRDYCRALVELVRATSPDVRGGPGQLMLVANPGTLPVNLELFELFDVVSTFEGPWNAYEHARATPIDVPAEAVWHLVYDCPADRHAAALGRARRLGAGHAFVTDRGLPNPWAGPPRHAMDR